MSAPRCSFRQPPDDRPCPAVAYYLLELTSKSGRRCRVCLCREHVHKAWGFGQQMLERRFPKVSQKLRSIRLMKLPPQGEPRKNPKQRTVRTRKSQRQDERRTFPRQISDFEIAYLYGQSLTFTRAVNVSLSGVAFLSTVRIAAGTELELKLISDVPFSTSWVPTESVVRRADGKVVGVEFSRSSDPHLRRFLASLH